MNQAHYQSTSMIKLSVPTQWMFGNCYDKAIKQILQPPKIMCHLLGNRHLVVKEVLLLFGGNERRIAGEKPTHQWLHRDSGEYDEEVFEDKTVPGSFLLLPLEARMRSSIYTYSPSNPVNIADGKMIVFQQNVPGRPPPWWVYY
jgi:hypothetical protein